MTHPEPFRTQPRTAPPGTYAKGGRSPIVWVYLCARCAGFAPVTPEGYDGALTGHCGGCGVHGTEVHRFRAVIDSAAGCGCTTSHPRVSGDLPATADTMLARAAALIAAIEDHIGQRAEDRATPLIESTGERAREMVAAAQFETTRQEALVAELRCRIEPLQRRADENRDARDRLAEALGPNQHAGRLLPDLVTAAVAEILEARGETGSA